MYNLTVRTGYTDYEMTFSLQPKRRVGGMSEDLSEFAWALWNRGFVTKVDVEKGPTFEVEAEKRVTSGQGTSRGEFSIVINARAYIPYKFNNPSKDARFDTVFQLQKWQEECEKKFEAEVNRLWEMVRVVEAVKLMSKV